MTTDFQLGKRLFEMYIYVYIQKSDGTMVSAPAQLNLWISFQKISICLPTSVSLSVHKIHGSIISDCFSIDDNRLWFGCLSSYGNFDGAYNIHRKSSIRTFALYFFFSWVGF